MTVSSPSSKSYKRLIVLVPGLWGKVSYWSSLRERLMQEPGFGSQDAKWLSPNQRLKTFTTRSMESLATELHAQIVAAWIQNNGFEEVILAGHSSGGVIARQAYLIAAGAVSYQSSHQWSQYTSRIVLLSSVNRGMPLQRVPGLKIVYWFGRHLRLVKVIKISELLQGSSFLTNLRVDWMHHFAQMRQAQRIDPSAPSPPIVIQMLGSRDSIVKNEDSRDIQAFPNGRELLVPGANHSDIYKLNIAPDPEERYALLREGFLGSFPKPAGTRSQQHLFNQQVERVIFLLHGIRSSNVDAWIGDIKQRIQIRDSEHTVVVHPTYGYFSAARFALPGVRKRNISVFQDWYTETLAKYPNAKFNIIAHSNGTYILGHSLLATPGMQFDNVVLAGSVLPQNFWRRFGDRLQHQIGRIRNERANRDWPVALLCNGLRGLMMNDVGTAGFAGFTGSFVEYEVAYYAGGHGAALNPENQEFLIDFVFGQTFQKPQRLLDSPGYFRQLSNAMPYIVRGATATLVIAAVLLLRYNAFQLQYVIAASAGVLCLYVALDIL